MGRLSRAETSIREAKLAEFKEQSVEFLLFVLSTLPESYIYEVVLHLKSVADHHAETSGGFSLSLSSSSSSPFSLNQPKAAAAYQALCASSSSANCMSCQSLGFGSRRVCDKCKVSTRAKRVREACRDTGIPIWKIFGPSSYMKKFDIEVCEFLISELRREDTGLAVKLEATLRLAVLYSASISRTSDLLG
eukprot:TRINITY_DN6867_c0_g1_i1.p1 TRINITY_DN6867_c0_g1~~TRINITY_DN6867_c0_g1_i1.p1  ORF type:complete len:191 (-),score=40.02 TRINITY_DN6867_c0_g1_i1:35-607(-)